MEKQQRQMPPTGERLARIFSVERRALDETARTVELAFSSEYGVDRGWGLEILEHSVSAMRLDRLRDGGPVLVEHNPKDHVGVVNQVEISDDRKARASIRFSKSQRASEVFQDVVDGIKSKVSVGYMVHKWEVDEDDETWRAVDWEPYEISFVSIPADPTVGVGRSAEPISTIRSEKIMTTESVAAPAAPAAPAAVDVQAITDQVRAKEIKRISDLESIGQSYKQYGSEALARQCINEGKQVGDLQALIMERVKSAPVPSAEIGMTNGEVRRFSFLRALHALANPTDQAAQRAAAFEFEASQAQAAKLGKTSRGLMVPEDVLRRDLITGTTSGTAKGGNLVATDLLSGSFIDVLRNKMVLPAAGARFMAGLQGNVAIPKKTTSSTSYWVGENAAPTEGAMVFGQVTMSPKTLAAYVDFSRRLAIQSSLDVENMVRDDLTTGIAVALDEAGLGGAKTNGPTGVRGTSGIGSVAIGTNGGAPTWASIVGLEKAVEVDNALLGSLAYITNAAVRGKLKTTPKQSSGVEGNFLLGESATSLNGYNFLTTNAVPSNLTKGSATSVCSAMLFGNWSDLIIGQWSGIDLLVDPYTGSKEGTVRVTAFVDVDVAVRYAESFSAVLDYTTT
ncbi:MAG: hypothetical protein QG586_585 [Pseudomonadota bacterium]|nr:hypothetical protein [Pseudomonadota bacterium]